MPDHNDDTDPQFGGFKQTFGPDDTFGSAGRGIFFDPYAVFDPGATVPDAQANLAQAIANAQSGIGDLSYLDFSPENLQAEALAATGFDALNNTGEGETFTPDSFEGVYDADAGGFKIDGVVYPYSGVSSPGPDGQPINVVDGGTYKLVTQENGSVSVEAVVGSGEGEEPKKDDLPEADGDYTLDDIIKVIGAINAGVYTAQEIAKIYDVPLKDVEEFVKNPPEPPTDPGAGAGTDPGAGTTPGGDGTGAITVDPYTGPVIGPLPPGGGNDTINGGGGNDTINGGGVNDDLNGETDSAENDDLDIDLNILPGLIGGTLLPKDDDPDPDPDPVAQPPLPVPVGGVPADPGFVTRDDVLVEFDTPDYDPYSILPAPTTEPFLADRRAGDIASSLDVLGFRPAQGLDQRPETMARVEDYAQRFGVGPQDFSQDSITPFETQFGINIPDASRNFPVRPENILETPRFDPTKPRDTEDDGDMRLFAGGGVAESSDGIGSLMKRREGAVTRMLLNKAGALPSFQNGGDVRRERRAAERAARMTGDRPVPRGVRFSEGLEAAPQYAFDYLSGTPLPEIASDVKSFGAGMVEEVLENPGRFLAETFVPGVAPYMGYKDYMELTTQAEQARAAGDTETADELNSLASFALASSFIPGGRTAVKPTVMGAVKTRGGVFGAKDAPAENRYSKSSLPDILYGYKESLKESGLSEPDAETVVKKARKFFTTEFGTEGDRLRQMMRDEEIMAQSDTDVSSTAAFGLGLQPFIQRARTADVLRGEQIAPVRAEFERLQNMRSRSGQFSGFDTIEDANKFIAARNELERLTRVDAPDVEPTDAMKAFESQYDRATGIGGIFLGDQARNASEVMERVQAEVARESQFPNQMPGGIDVIEDPLNPTYSSDEITGFDFVNDPTFARAMENQEVIYDLTGGYFDEGLAFLLPERFSAAVADLNLSSDELSKISFPELVKRSVEVGDASRKASQAASQANNALGSFFREYKKYTPIDEPRRQELLKRVPRAVKFEGLKEVLSGREKTWHRITDPNWTALEGQMMGHSVGGYARPGSTYNLGGRKAFKEGTARVYTLRDNRTGNPTVTVDVDFSDVDNPMINQVYGPNDDKVGMKDIEQLYGLFDELKIDPKEGFSFGEGREYRSSYQFYKDTDAAFTPEALSRGREEQLLFAEPEGPAEQRAGFDPEQVREIQRGQDPMFGPDEVRPLDTPDPQQERRRAGIRRLFGLEPDDD